MQTAEAAAIDRRMLNQGLWRPAGSDLPGVLRGFAGMQAQEFHYALWAFAQRIAPAPTRADLLTAFDDGVILRTHVLRTTWHFALPEDVRWLLRLTAPRLRRLMAYYDRQLAVDRHELDRAEAALAQAVADGQHRTRKELGAALEAAGIPATGQRLGHFMMHAEYDEVLISGAMRGRQHTYAAFDERVPPGPDLSEDDALAELARRFVATRAPVTAKDLAVWASLSLTQARRGLAAIETGLSVGDLDGMTVYSAGPESAESFERRSPIVDLVQGYDEVVMSYSESRRLLTGGVATLPVPDWTSYAHAILVDGTLVGYWRHQLSAAGAIIETQLRRPMTDAERAALDAAVDRYGRFLEVPTDLAEPTMLA